MFCRGSWRLPVPELEVTYLWLSFPSCGVTWSNRKSCMFCLDLLAHSVSVLLFSRNGFGDVLSPRDAEVARPGRKQSSQKRVSSILFLQRLFIFFLIIACRVHKTACIFATALFLSMLRMVFKCTASYSLFFTCLKWGMYEYNVKLLSDLWGVLQSKFCYWTVSYFPLFIICFVFCVVFSCIKKENSSLTKLSLQYLKTSRKGC